MGEINGRTNSALFVTHHGRSDGSLALHQSSSRSKRYGRFSEAAWGVTTNLRMGRCISLMTHLLVVGKPVRVFFGEVGGIL
ncbi:hypothetical protein HAX54_001617, partial [Datura stramonium]|nr:hypothetical protein [Datura stramonium]